VYWTLASDPGSTGLSHHLDLGHSIYAGYDMSNVA
jgi:hypothetical protein